HGRRLARAGEVGVVDLFWKRACLGFLAWYSQPAPSGEHRAPLGNVRGELGQSDVLGHVQVARLDPAPSEVRLVPESGASPVLYERAPPLRVGTGSGPALQ